jgi:hypothetical protein
MKMGISPLDLRQIEFYEVEYLIQELEQYTEEENKRNSKQESEYKKQSQSSYKNPAASSNYGGFKTPKMAVPKIPRPKI